MKSMGWVAYLVVCLGLASCAGSNGGSLSASTGMTVASGSGPALVVADEIPFAADADVRQAVRDECQLPSKLSHFIKEYASDYASQISSDPAQAPKTAQILTVEIYEALGSGGGAWSGGKSVSIRGTLTEDGKTIGSFKGRRYSGGGMFAGYKGTCSILGRCVKALGKDIAEWLRHPSENAILGDM